MGGILRLSIESATPLSIENMCGCRSSPPFAMKSCFYKDAYLLYAIVFVDIKDEFIVLHIFAVLLC